MWGSLIVIAAGGLYLVGVVFALVQRLVGAEQGVSRSIVWASGAPLLLGMVMIGTDMVILAPRRRGGAALFEDPVNEPRITVVLTAFNDEDSIGLAVDDFTAHEMVERVIVVENDSHDRTAEVAAEHGAIVLSEKRPGYGNCVYTALHVASRYTDTPLVGLCEGDRTFRARDLDKLVAYSGHAHVVNGTRIVEQLRSPETQLTAFMFYGNFAVAKLLELKHLGRGTLSDVGTTYKLCRSDFLRSEMSLFNPDVNLEFNAHFLDRVLGSGARLVEAPITFHPRVGVSKGGNTSNGRAAMVGLSMVGGIVFGWKAGARERRE